LVNSPVRPVKNLSYPHSYLDEQKETFNIVELIAQFAQSQECQNHIK